MRILITAAALAASLAATASAQTVKVGFIASFSGPNAALGDSMDKAVRLYEKLHAKDIAPVQVEIIRRDDTGPSPDVAKRLAQELIVRDKVSILTGFVFTPNVAAVAPLSKQAHVPMLLMNTGTSGLLDMSPYMVRFSFGVWQIGYTLGQWAAENGIKTATIAVSDFSGGLDYGAAMEKGFTDHGGTVKEMVRMPLNNPDFVPIVQRIRDSAPQAVLVFNPGGQQATAFMKAAQELGLERAGIRVLGTGDITPDEQLANMTGVDIPAVTAQQYAATGDRPENEAFVQAWRAEYGPDSTPNAMSASAWEVMSAIYGAAKAEDGKMDPDRTLDLLRHYADEHSIRGPLHIDPQSRDVVQNVYMRRLQRTDGKLENHEFQTVSQVGDPGHPVKP